MSNQEDEKYSNETDSGQTLFVAEPLQQQRVNIVWDEQRQQQHQQQRQQQHQQQLQQRRRQQRQQP